MKIRISHGASSAMGEDWFVVHPLEGRKQHTVGDNYIDHDQAVMSLLSAGRTVYELELPDVTDDPRMGIASGIWTRITLTP